MSWIDFLEKTVLLTGDGGFLRDIGDEWLAEMRAEGYTIKDLRDPSIKQRPERRRAYMAKRWESDELS